MYTHAGVARNRRACRLLLIPDRSPRFPMACEISSTSELALSHPPPPAKCYAQSIHQPRTIACRCAQRGRVNAQQGRCPLNPRRFLTARVNRSISDFHVELSLLAVIVLGSVARQIRTSSLSPRLSPPLPATRSLQSLRKETAPGTEIYTAFTDFTSNVRRSFFYRGGNL